MTRLIDKITPRSVDDRTYLGYHRTFGGIYFEVFRRGGAFYYQQHDGWDHQGCVEGPFKRARDAYIDGMENIQDE
jgi:hypothetical protein